MIPNSNQHPALAQAIDHEVFTNGYRIESQSEVRAVLVKGQPTNHILHLVLTAVTCFAWGPVWGVMAYLNRRQAIMLTLHPDGLVSRQMSK